MFFWYVQVIWCWHNVRNMASHIFPESSGFQIWEAPFPPFWTISMWCEVHTCCCVCAGFLILTQYETSLHRLFQGSKASKLEKHFVSQCCKVSMQCEANRFFEMCWWFSFSHSVRNMPSHFVQSTHVFQIWRSIFTVLESFTAMWCEQVCWFEVQIYFAKTVQQKVYTACGQQSVCSMWPTMCNRC